LKLRIALLLLACGTLFSSAGKPSPREECLAKCKGRCTASLDSCKKKAQSETAVQACQKSYDVCTSICVNKACPSAPAK